jgi:hypothetical protein
MLQQDRFVAGVGHPNDGSRVHASHRQPDRWRAVDQGVRDELRDQEQRVVGVGEMVRTRPAPQELPRQGRRGERGRQHAPGRRARRAAACHAIQAMTASVSRISLDDEDFSDRDRGRQAAHCDTEAFEAFEALTAA